MDKLKKACSRICIPNNQQIYKDECIISFDNPESETGIYICLNTFIGLGENYIQDFYKKTANSVFLHIKCIKSEILNRESEPEKKIARLAIGVDGGFNLNSESKKYNVEEQYKIVLLPDFEQFPYPDPDLPEMVLQSVDGILKSESAFKKAEAAATNLSWDGELRGITRHAENLQQLENGVKIPSSGWKCAECDKKENLWLNLTDGTILCGRRQLDGSGGNNHAVDYYRKTGYPLSVKLGTITADAKADVFSYTEDDMVIDPNLSKHLSTFGINVQKMEKTEKTMAELEIDYNQRAWEWSKLTESDKQLEPIYGSGYTGFQNLGNSCYMNSVMQSLLTVPSFVKRFFNKRSEILNNSNWVNAASDFNVQMSKLADGVLSGRYSKAPENLDAEKTMMQEGIAPVMFRTLVGHGHVEFSTKRQQDAMEFLEHILKLTTRNSKGTRDPGHCFKFEVEDKFKCGESGKVRYVKRNDMYLPLTVPMHEATNKTEVDDYFARKKHAEDNKEFFKIDNEMHYHMPFSSCLSKLANAEDITAFSSEVQKDVIMQKITRLTTFPDYLFIQLVKFGLTDDWQPIKYDVSVDMPDELDLSCLRGFGVQPNEQLLPESSSNALTNEVTENAEFIANEEGLATLMSMGFSLEQARLALKNTSNNLERAADWIFSHNTQELDVLLAADDNKSKEKTVPVQESLTDGDPKYELIAFISHMGTSIFVGHYVAHIKKDNKWILFNDEKVSISKNPPKDLGYIYLYKRL